MLGAIAGDIIGSAYEYRDKPSQGFQLFTPESRFTDDTVLSVAVADAILRRRSYRESLLENFRSYPLAGYGSGFIMWALAGGRGDRKSYGNGSAMRVSPVGFAFDDLDKVLKEAKKSAEPSHGHKEGIKGAQAVASAIFLARTGKTKKEIKDYVEKTFGYSLSSPLDEVRRTANFDVTCQVTVPQALTAFLESEDFESAVRNAVSIGGDTDTLGAMAGGVAQAFYRDIPDSIVTETFTRLDRKLQDIVIEFHRKYITEM